MELYGRIFRVVEPKRQRLNAAMEQLAEKQASLQAAKDKLAAVNAKIEELKQDVCLYINFMKAIISVKFSSIRPTLC